MSEEINSLEEIWQRIERALTTIETKSDLSFSQLYVINDMATNLKVTGIKSPEQLADELLNIFVWPWSIKDYLIEVYKKFSLDHKIIEKLVNRTFTSQLISDIANRSSMALLEKVALKDTPS